MTDPANDIITGFADDVAARVLDGIGEQNVRSIFVGGSVAGGEALFCRTDNFVDIYSDVDLYAVVSDNTDVEKAKHRVHELAADVPLQGDGFRFRRSPDVGVYTLDDLAGQPARPGTVGLDGRHLMLHGDPDVPLRAAERIGRRISIEEALYLLENRLTELAALQSGRQSSGVAPVPDDPFFTFVVCKSGLDAATASYIVRGHYDPRRSERVRMLRTLAEAAGEDEAWSEKNLDLVRRCGDALDRLPSSEWTAGIDAVAGADKIVSVMLDLWKRISAAHLGGDPGDWCDLVLRRCRAGDYMGNFREFRAMNARCGFRKRRALAAGIHLSRYSPGAALRLSALTDYLAKRVGSRDDVERLVATFNQFLDRLTGDCGFTEGSLADRAYRMYSASQ